MTEQFGKFLRSAPWQIMRLSKTRIDQTALLDTIDSYMDSQPEGDLQVRLIDPLNSEPVISVEENERRVRVSVPELLRDLERARVPNDPAALALAFQEWVDQRPVTDQAASQTGVAILNWVDGERNKVAWQVVVRRGTAVSVWLPSVLTDTANTFLIRETAKERSRHIPVEISVSHNVALVSSPTAPLLASVALLNPADIVGALEKHDHTQHTLHVVIAPPGPLACANERAAKRLSGETTEPHVTLPLADIHFLEWI